MERIPLHNWRDHTGHVQRYQWAGMKTYMGERVNDVACGIGYGSIFFTRCKYQGFDRPQVVESIEFPGVWHGVDLDSHGFWPPDTDVTVCFETLEHVQNPFRLASVISQTTQRAVMVSVPTVPTTQMNPYHLHDFTVDDIPPLFPGFRVVERWSQPQECSHVWLFERVLL